MSSSAEAAFIEKFIVKQKRERYLNFLSNKKTRTKFTANLYHFKDLNWALFEEISGIHPTTAIQTAIQAHNNITTCSIISADKNIDGQELSTSEAINSIVSTEATIIIFGNADVIYYEGEAPKRRYISL